MNEPEELKGRQRSQAALQIAEAIEQVAAIARDSGFPSVGVMLDMARDLARSEHVKAEERPKERALNSETGG
jgi:hypothetical protein